MTGFKDFTLDNKNFGDLPELMKSTKDEMGLRWLLILDPAIQANDSSYETYTDGVKNDVFIKWSKSVEIKDRNNPPNVDVDHDILYGRVWPNGPAAFPDFFKNSTKLWWKNQINKTYTDLKMPFDGLWIVSQDSKMFSTKTLI